MHRPDPADRLGQGVADRGIELVGRGRQSLDRDAQVLRAHAVEPDGEVAQRGGAPRAHVVQDRCDGGGGVLDVQRGTRQDAQEVAAAEHGTAQVDPDHEP